MLAFSRCCCRPSLAGKWRLMADSSKTAGEDSTHEQKGRAEMETPGVVGGFGLCLGALIAGRWNGCGQQEIEVSSPVQSTPTPAQEHGLTLTKSRHAHCAF